MLPLFVSWTITDVCVTSLLALKNWGQKYYHTLGIRHYRHWIVGTIKKGNDRYLWSGVKTFTPCAARTIIFKRESVNYLIASFTRCTLPFQCVCFLLPICLPCVNCGTYCIAHKCCVLTHRAADIRVALLDLNSCLRSHVLRAHCNFESKQANLITLFGRRSNNKRTNCLGEK